MCSASYLHSDCLLSWTNFVCVFVVINVSGITNMYVSMYVCACMWCWNVCGCFVVDFILFEIRNYTLGFIVYTRRVLYWDFRQVEKVLSLPKIIEHLRGNCLIGQDAEKQRALFQSYCRGCKNDQEEPLSRYWNLRFRSLMTFGKQPALRQSINCGFFENPAELIKVNLYLHIESQSHLPSKPPSQKNDANDLWTPWEYPMSEESRRMN